MPGKQLTQKQIDSEVSRDDYAQSAANPGEQRRLTVVVALNAAEFAQWCQANGKNARDRNLLMATPASVRGLQGAHLEITPRGMWRADIHALMAALIPMLDKPSQRRMTEAGWGLPVP